MSLYRQSVTGHWRWELETTKRK